MNTTSALGARSSRPGKPQLATHHCNKLGDFTPLNTLPPATGKVAKEVACGGDGAAGGDGVAAVMVTATLGILSAKSHTFSISLGLVDVRG